MTDSLPSDFIADGTPFENPAESADAAYAATTPSLGAKLGADLGDGLTAALGRAGQRGQQPGASWFDRLAATPDVDTAAGMVVGGQDPYPAPVPSPTISAEEANKRFAPPGTTITDGPMSEGLARVVGQQKAGEVKRDSILSRYAAGHGTLTNLGVGAVSSLLDPLQDAVMFVPGIGEETIAAHLGEGMVARTMARAGAGASAGAIGMGVTAAAKYALGTEQSSDYSVRDAMYDMAGGAALGALGHAGFGALREAGILKPDGLMQAERARAAAGLQPAEAPTGLVSNEDLGAVLDAPASARLDAMNAGVAQVLDGRQVDVTSIFDQVRADRAEADLQRWTAQQGRLDAQSTAALRASSLSDTAAGTVESRAAVLQKRLDDLRGQHAGFLADIERTEAQRTAQTDTVTPQRLQAIDAELSDTAIPAARRTDLESERTLLTQGRDPAADALEAARTEAELQGLQRGAAAVQVDIAKTTAKVEPLQAKAAAQRTAGSDALGAVSDRVGAQEDMLRSLAARSIRRYAGAFGAGVTKDEADALAARTLRGGPGEVAKVVAEIRGRAAPSTALSPQPAPALAGPPIEQQRAAIANDVARQLVAAGRPEGEARAHGRIVAAHYEARASRFGGTLGTAEDLYRQRAAEIRGPDAAPAPATSPDGGGDVGGGSAAVAGEIPSTAASQVYDRASITARFSDDQGRLDMARASDAVRAEVGAALDQGRPVTYHVEGRSIPIVSADGGRLVDDKGQAWGLFQILQPLPGDANRIEVGAPRVGSDVQMLADRGQGSPPETGGFGSEGNQSSPKRNASEINAPTNDPSLIPPGRGSEISATSDGQGSPPLGEPIPGLDIAAEPEIAPGEPAAPQPAEVEQVAAEAMPEAVEPVRAAVEARDQAEAAAPVADAQSLRAMLDRGASPEEMAAHPYVRAAEAEIARAEPTNLRWGPDRHYPSEAWMASRTFSFGDEAVTGYEPAVSRLVDKAESYAGGPVKAERQAFIVVGPPAAGKSTVSERMAQHTSSAIVDPDDAKAVLPEYNGGVGANAVHEESGVLAAKVLVDQMERGHNLVIPKVGDKAVSIARLIGQLADQGYTAHIVNMNVAPPEAFRRMIGRFLNTGRIIPADYFQSIGTKPTDTFNILKNDRRVVSHAEIDGNGPRGAQPVTGDGAARDAILGGGRERPALSGRGDAGAGAPASAPPADTARAAEAAGAAEPGQAVDQGAAAAKALPRYTPEADAAAAPRGKDQPAGVFMFDPVALAVDAARFQFKSGGDAEGVTGALRGVTRWDPAKAQSIMVWEQADGRLFIADGHQRAGLARRLTEGGQATGIELPGVLYRERDGISAQDARAIAAVTNIANGSGSALDGAKVLRARPDLMDGSVPLSAGKGEQAAALARLDDEAFRLVVNEVVPEHFGAVVGQVIPADGPRQVAAFKAIARFEPRSVEEATALTQRVSTAELARAEEGRQASLFGELDAPESTAGEEMRIVARTIRDMRRDRSLFSRVLANASRLEASGSTIERGAARSAATDAGAFAKILSADAYTAGPTRTALIEAARDLRDGKTSIGDASARLYAAIRRSAQDDGLDRVGARLGDAASQGDALGSARDPGEGRATVGPERDGARSGADGTGDAAARSGGSSRRADDAGRSGSLVAVGEGREDAAAGARRGDPGSAARDGYGPLLGRLIGGDAAQDVLFDRAATLAQQVRSRAGDAVADLRRIFGADRGEKLAADPMKAIRWLDDPADADRWFTRPEQREAIRAYGEAARQARDDIGAENMEAKRRQYAEADANPSPFDERVTLDQAHGVKTGIGDGEMRVGPDGDTYLLNGIEHNEFTGARTTRWLSLGPAANVSDSIAALRAISGVKEDSPLGVTSRAMREIYRHLGAAETPVFSLQPETWRKVIWAHDAAGMFSGGRRMIFLQEDGPALDQLKTAVHEGAHAAFDRALRNDPEVMSGINALLEHARGYRDLQTEFADRDESVAYGLSTATEYVPEAFSNPSFQRFLSQIPTTPELLARLGLDKVASPIKSVWDAFLHVVGRAFGMAPNAETMSLLEATIRYGDRMSDSLYRGPRTLMQEGSAGARGSITFRDGDRPLLRLMADADASTFLHEMGHDWLEQMMRDAAHPAAPEAFRADAQTVRDWLGSDGGALTTEQHERFATGFEQYLRAGEAPAPELAGVFAQLRDWLTRIYRTVTGLGAPISPEIKAVFDRLLTPEADRPAPQVPARPDVAALAQRQQAIYRAGFAPGIPQAEFDALNEAVYGAKPPGDGELRAAAPAATSAARAGDAQGSAAAGAPAKTAADATLAAWQQRFQAAGVVPTAEERALIEATGARLKAADLAAEGYAQAGECLTAAGI